MAAGDQSKQVNSVVRARLGDKAGVTWSDAEVYEYLNEGLRELGRQLPDAALWALTKIASQALTGGVSAYSLPSDFLRLRRLEYKGIEATLWPVVERDALRDEYVVGASETNPFYYLSEGKVNFVVGAVTQSDGETYELWYIRRPTAITGSVDPDLGEPFFNLIEDWAVHRCLEQANELEQAAFHRGWFQAQVDLIKARYSGKPSFDDVPTDPALRPTGG